MTGCFRNWAAPPHRESALPLDWNGVILALPDSVLPPPDPWVFIAAFGEKGKAAGLSLLDSLRAQRVKADTDYQASTLKTLLRAADRLGAPYVAILGDDEIADDRIILRNMTTKEQEIHPLGTACSAIIHRLQ